DDVGKYTRAIGITSCKPARVGQKPPRPLESNVSYCFRCTNLSADEKVDCRADAYHAAGKAALAGMLGEDFLLWGPKCDEAELGTGPRDACDRSDSLRSLRIEVAGRSVGTGDVQQAIRVVAEFAPGFS